METKEKPTDEVVDRSRSGLVVPSMAGVIGLVVGMVIGAVALSGGPSVSADADPAQIVASTIDDLNTAYVYGDMALIDEIFGEEMVFSLDGREFVGPGGADFFKENAGDGSVARRVTEPEENPDGTYAFVMELLPPNQLQPLVFEGHATVEDGRVVRFVQGDRILPDSQGDG